MRPASENATPRKIPPVFNGFARLMKRPCGRRAARCFEHFLGEKREEVRRQISTFEAALDTQDSVAADHARAHLLSALDALEGQSFL